MIEPLEARVLLAAAGLVAAYAFDEGTGTSVADASGSGNKGTISGTTWSALGKYGGALSFNGASSSVTVPDANSLDLTAGLTLEAWVKPARASNGGTVLAKNGSGFAAYSLYAQDGTPPGAYVYTGGDRAVNGSGALPLNTWTHLAGTYDGASLRLYVNGAQVGSGAVTGNAVTTTGALVIGKSLWGEYFNGLMDDVRVYNRALTQTELQTDMNTPVGPAAPDTAAPTVSVTAPADGSTVSGTAALTATAADNVGVAGVQFFFDGTTPIGSEDTAAPYSVSWNTAAVANGAHTITARARDAAGNATTSAVLNVTVNNVVDVTAPTVSVTGPADGATVSGTAVAVTATASDDVGVIGVQFQLDGVNLGAEDTAAPYTVNWNTVTTPNGAHQLTAVARDAAGHLTTSAAVNVSVANSDTAAPTVALSAPANGATVSGAAVNVAATASDNVGIAGVQFLLDGVPVGAEDTAAPYSISWDSRTVANGNHTLAARARDAAGNVATSAARTVTVSNVTTDPAVNGQWSGVMNWPLVAINMILAHTGQILMFDGGPVADGGTTATLWDPVTNAFAPVPYGPTNLFCAGNVVLADGRIAIVGGHDSDNNVLGDAGLSIFDPVTRTWTTGARMAYRRWYPTATLLPDGRVLATSGSETDEAAFVQIPEVYDPVANTWTRLAGAGSDIPLYPYMFVLPDGRVLEAGSEGTITTRVLDVATQSWSTVDPVAVPGGSAVMYAPGKVLKAGSSDLAASRSTAYTIDMTQPSPRWQQTASMANPRTYLDLTVLPDGNVLATGGSTDGNGVDPTKAVYPAEQWSPATGTWTTLASMQVPRMYHSSALLLPDGRVLVAGGGHNYVNNNDYFSSQVYSPPYLFKGARPAITSVQDTVQYNASFFVQTPDAARIASVSLVRPGAVTHSFDEDQRFVPLSFTQGAGGLNVRAPADANVAPPGYYMLFIVDSNGVPSVAPFVRLPAAYEDAQAPTAPSNLAATAPTSGTVALNWNVATDNVGVAKYNVHRSNVSNFTPTTANRVAQVAGTTFTDTGLAAGTWYYVVTAQDAAGNVGPASNTASATVTVTADTTAPTVSLTSPASGSTVSGTVNVAAAASDNVAVAGVQFSVDGVAFGAEDTAAPYAVAWNSATVANGQHTITARARDAAGNVTTSAAVSVTVSNSAVAPGLVAAYNFNAGSGTTLADTSGNNLNGDISNATWASGRSGGALSFNGSSSFVTIGDNNMLDLTTGMTLEAWVYPTRATGGGAVLMKNGSDFAAYSLYAQDGTPPGAYVYVNGDKVVNGSGALPLNTWTHLASTYDGASLKLYVNGVLVATRAVTGSITTTTGALVIGRSLWGEYFAGLIDDVRVYNRALSQSEIQGDMNTPVA